MYRPRSARRFRSDDLPLTSALADGPGSVQIRGTGGSAGNGEQRAARAAGLGHGVAASGARAGRWGCRQVPSEGRSARMGRSSGGGQREREMARTSTWLPSVTSPRLSCWRGRGAVLFSRLPPSCRAACAAFDRARSLLQSARPPSAAHPFVVAVVRARPRRRRRVDCVARLFCLRLPNRRASLLCPRSAAERPRCSETLSRFHLHHHHHHHHSHHHPSADASPRSPPPPAATAVGCCTTLPTIVPA